MGRRESFSGAALMRRLVLAALSLSLTGCLHKGFLDDTPQGIPGHTSGGQAPTPWYVSPAAAVNYAKTVKK